MTPTAANLMIAAKRGKQYKKNDRFNKTVWYNKDRKEIEKRSKKKMKHTYDEYDFERLYSDVNEFYYESDYGFSTPLYASYDTYTGSSDDYYYGWN